MILESRAFPSIPSSSKKIFLQVFFFIFSYNVIEGVEWQRKRG